MQPAVSTSGGQVVFDRTVSESGSNTMRCGRQKDCAWRDGSSFLQTMCRHLAPYFGKKPEGVLGLLWRVGSTRASHSHRVTVALREGSPSMMHSTVLLASSTHQEATSYGNGGLGLEPSGMGPYTAFTMGAPVAMKSKALL